LAWALAFVLLQSGCIVDAYSIAPLEIMMMFLLYFNSAKNLSLL
jgi:hypothetical protein